LIDCLGAGQDVWAVTRDVRGLIELNDGGYGNDFVEGLSRRHYCDVPPASSAWKIKDWSHLDWVLIVEPQFPVERDVNGSDFRLRE
jgi:hypothetical protein